MSTVLLNKYLQTFVLDKSELPLHYQISIDVRLREVALFGIEHFLNHLSSILNCAVFYFDEEDNFEVRGLANLVDDNIIEENGDLKLLLSLLEDREEIKKVIDQNFTLYPILVTKINSAVFISTSIKLYRADASFKLVRLGFVAPLKINFDLAIPILQYLRLNNPPL